MNDNKSILRIALIGPESTGKSTLCRDLAENFNTVFVPEFAREYMSKLKKKYTEEDVIHCIREQFNLETTLIKSAKHFIFCDTESIMAKIWMEDVYKYCPDWVINLIEENPYDLYLLTNNDLPYEHDPVRENPLRRDYFFRCYERELKTRKLPYAVISGMGSERLTNAINIIHNFFEKS